jgi:hypothetical protein
MHNEIRQKEIAANKEYFALEELFKAKYYA